MDEDIARARQPGVIDHIVGVGLARGAEARAGVQPVVPVAREAARVVSCSVSRSRCAQH